MAVVPAPFRFLEVQRELVGADAALFSQSGFGKTPERFDAVDMALAMRKFIFMVMHSVMLEAVPHQSIIRLPAVGVDGGGAFDLAMNHP